MRLHVARRGIVALAFAAVIAGCAASAGEGETEGSETIAANVATDGVATAPVPVDPSPSELSGLQGISIGSENAPVVVYEFADFQCPGCAQVAAVVTPFLKEHYVATNRVRFIYYDYPLTRIHPHAFLAARAGRCANEQEAFWEYHDRLYTLQAQWAAEQSAPFDLFTQYAGQVGLDTEEFASCLRSDRYAREVSASMELGDYLGVRGTPTVFVNGRRVEFRSLADLQRILDQELGSAPVEG